MNPVQDLGVYRLSASEACEELKRYCLEHQQDDHLLSGSLSDDDPFKESRKCIIL
ncbi:guanine nucleotide-binding protein G(I)/G(S)/G(O) subunit gamma-7-like [Brevipalpus obovatus]|uniref:guanine nucleotide-binding protein G(I)/G(S)/G(O) subunit gamma-7-like n=1 Tax=Brevipalpus obovatus TaxID=246614 RepID=UPI003D9F96C6